MTNDLEPCTLVLFGASGDLTQRMVMPAIFRLARRGLLPPEFRLIGYARTEMTDDEFRLRMRKAVMGEPKEGDEAAWSAFAARLSYIRGEYEGEDARGYAELGRRFDPVDDPSGAAARRLFYLATPPAQFAPIMKNLSNAKLAGFGYQPGASGWARFVIEKPFGRDLASARSLNADIARDFDENDIYRIDHFLGKETVQNLLALRFANGIFEPVWNRNYIDHVQITAAETLGMEGRGGYYETAGAMRDMVQNHLLQLCALIAIEPPAEWSPRAMRDEKVKALRSVRRIKPDEVSRCAVRGQYAAGEVSAKTVPGYREEEGVAKDSATETYAALTLYVDNWRWAGVPFSLRSGKRLTARSTEVVITFKQAPHTPFARSDGGAAVRPNTLVASISPHEGVVLQVEGKLPGQEMRLRPIDLDFWYTEDKGAVASPSAYERLLLDALRGDPTFFARADEVEAAWEIVEPVIEAWKSEVPKDFPNYKAGSSGPQASRGLPDRTDVSGGATMNAGAASAGSEARSRRSRLALISILVVILGACAAKAKLPVSAGTGANPVLPPPERSLIPMVNVVTAKGWSKGAKPIPAAGMAVDAFARGLDHPRWIYVLPNGDVLVAETNGPVRPENNKGIKGWFFKYFQKKAGGATPSANRLTLLRDSDEDGVAETRTVFLSGLKSPFGMVLIGGDFYVANTDALVRFRYEAGQTQIEGPGAKVIDLPGGPLNRHWTKNVVASADGSKLYVAIGSNSNVGENGIEKEEGRAAIWEVDPATGAHRVFAFGLRNPVGMSFEPESGSLWTAVNERDELGSDLVPDYMTAVRDGAFYGWPYSYYGQHIDTRVKPQRPDLVAKAIPPDYALGPHTASLGLVFSRNTSLPTRFRHGVFVGQHGSWNRKPRSGYKVIFVPFTSGRPSGEPIDVLSGFVDAHGGAMGRPAGVAMDKSGALLVADDVGNVVWRVRNAGEIPVRPPAKE